MKQIPANYGSCRLYRRASQVYGKTSVKAYKKIFEKITESGREL